MLISTMDTIFPNLTYKFPEYTEAQLDKMFEWVEPYMWELPPIPDKKLNDSTLLWIDSNNNWVRDDLEIWIVENFWRDKMVVESFFAYVRSDALDMIIQRDWLFTDELYERDIVVRDALDVSCNSDFMNISKYWYDSSEEYLIFMWLIDKINNTKLRKINVKGFSKNMSGRVSKSIESNLVICRDFFEEAKTYKIY